MADKPKRVTPDELMAFIKSMPKGKLDEISARAARIQRGAADTRCEEFFSKMDLLLPTHDNSHREAHNLLTRLVAGRPNLPQEGV